MVASIPGSWETLSKRTYNMEGFIEGAKLPSHSLDERCDPEYARVIVVINGLRVKNKAVFQFPPVAKETSNADIKLSFEDREFNLVVYVKMKERENDCYQLRAKTPQTIEPEPKSFYKVEKDKIIIFLKKQIKKSWLQVGDNIDVLEPEDDTV